MMKSLKAGFTLAEVLVTLMVIGVVAAMTIPTLMASTNNQQDTVATKKAASVLSGAVQLLTAQDTTCGNTNAASTVQANSEALAACMTKVLSGNVIAGNAMNNVLNTTDGMQMAFYAPESDNPFQSIADCGTSAMGTTAAAFHGAGSCAVVVDVNGSKKGTSITDANPQFPAAAGFNRAQGFNNNPQKGSDIVAFSMSAFSVRPLLYADGTNPAYAAVYGVDNPVAADIYERQKTCYWNKSEIDNCYCKQEFAAGTNCATTGGNYTADAATRANECVGCP